LRLRLAALSALGLAAGLLLAEGLARLLLPAAAGSVRMNRWPESERGKFCRYHPSLGWEGLPSVSADHAWADFRCRVTQNASGFRGPDIPLERSPGRRVVVLGDSFVWGFGAGDGSLFTDRLARRSKGALEVVNLGVSGYGTDQEYLLWRSRGRLWKPDEVWVFVTPVTDLADVAASRRYGYEKPRFDFDAKGRYRIVNHPVPRVPPDERAHEYAGEPPPEPVRRLIARSDLFCALLSAAARSSVLREALERRAWLPRMRPGHAWEPPLYRDPTDPDLVPLWSALSGLLSLLAEDVRRSGAKLTIAAVPSPVQVAPRLWRRFLDEAPPLPDGARYDKEAPTRILSAIAAGVGADFVDLAPGLRARGGASLYYPVNLHWTEDGHRAVADILSESLP